MPRKEHHVVPNPNDEWDMKRKGAERASAHTTTKQEAIDKGRTMRKNQETESVTHDLKTTITYVRM